MQPMDAGLISAFKRHYRNYHLQSALAKVDQGLDMIYNIDQFTTMKWSIAAWEEISTQKITDCFKHTGLFEESNPCHTLEADELSIEIKLQEAFKRLAIRNAMSVASSLAPIEEDYGAIE
ncbi:hypothetical protein K3495_g3248 [Podosphaera aphanis]|nr:hypothetical protein K3495_g3248 [Podosphaera aphanis]